MRVTVCLLAIGLIAALSTFGGRLLRLRAALGVEQFVDTGFPFLLAGVLLGPFGSRLLTDAVVRDLDPLVTLALGGFGFLVGLEMDRRMFVGDRGKLVLGAVAQSLITMLLVAVPSVSILEFLSDEPLEYRLATGLLLGAAAAISSGKALAAIERRRPSATGDGELAMRIADLDSFFVILAAGVIYSFLHVPAEGAIPLPGWQRLLATAALGVVCAVGIWLLTADPAEKDAPVADGAERPVYVVGMLLLCVGDGAFLRLSPVAVGLIAGIALRSMPGELGETTRARLQPMETALATIFLLLAGASWRLSSTRALWLLPGYFLFRLSGKIIGGAVAGRINSADDPLRLGLGLLSPGVLAIGLALNYQSAFPASSSLPVSRAAVAAIIWGTMLSEAAAVWTSHVFRRGIAR